jgi:hypothetical protein
MDSQRSAMSKINNVTNRKEEICKREVVRTISLRAPTPCKFALLPAKKGNVLSSSADTVVVDTKPKGEGLSGTISQASGLGIPGDSF